MFSYFSLMFLNQIISESQGYVTVLSSGPGVAESLSALFKLNKISLKESIKFRYKFYHLDSNFGLFALALIFIRYSLLVLAK